MKVTKLLLSSIWLLIICAVLVGCNISSSTSSSQAIALTDSPTSPPTPSPTPLTITSSVEIIGEEEMVYDMSKDHCPGGGAPDLPIRGFRNAEGQVQFNLSGPTNFRMIGKDIDSVQIDCNPTIPSDLDPDPAQFNFVEWMGSVYTLDGKTVYALIHNEYHGEEGSDWHAVRDFSSTQGEHNWYYQSWNGSTYRDMVYNANNDRWLGPKHWCEIGLGWFSPNQGCDATRTWVSPVSATVTISGTVSDIYNGGNNNTNLGLCKLNPITFELVSVGTPKTCSFNLS